MDLSQSDRTLTDTPTRIAVHVLMMRCWFILDHVTCEGDSIHLVRELWQYFFITDASDEWGLLHYTNWARAFANIKCIQAFRVWRAPRKRLEDIQIIIRLSGGEDSLSLSLSLSLSFSLSFSLSLADLLDSPEQLFITYAAASLPPCFCPLPFHSPFRFIHSPFRFIRKNLVSSSPGSSLDDTLTSSVRLLLRLLFKGEESVDRTQTSSVSETKLSSELSFSEASFSEPPPCFATGTYASPAARAFLSLFVRTRGRGRP